MPALASVVAVGVVAALFAGGCPAADFTRVIPTDATVLVGAGDIADCSDRSARTAGLVEQVLARSPNARAFTAGDNAYPRGGPDELARCYEPTWGRFKERTIPVAGNHDWLTPGAAGFLGYFGLSGEHPTYRSLDLGGWHVIVLDSDCAAVGGCDAASPQGRWLAADLAASAARCTLALWHHPRFSSGAQHGSDTRSAALWRLLDEANAELVVAGHEHIYERFVALRADGSAAEDEGLVSFIAGTGGAHPYGVAARAAGSAAVRNDSAGVLVLILEERRARTFFVDVHGARFDETVIDCR